MKFLTGKDREAIKRSSALLLLKLKEEHRCTQAAINTIVEGYSALYATMMQHLQAALRGKLAELGFNPNDVEAIQEVFNEVEEPFAALATESQQNAYFAKELQLVVCE